MSFNSLIFILLFLPLSVVGYYVLSLTPLHRLRLPFLIMMSLLFYGRAQVTYIPLLLGSIIANYLIAVMIVRNMAKERIKQLWLALGVIANTGALISLKYLSTVVGAIFSIRGHSNPLAGLVAPLAISFYTFQQISFLVDVARRKVEIGGIVRYMSFVAFFPTLLAGPITLYSELGPQLGIRPQRKGTAQNLLIGLIIFSLGLFKKTVIADTMGLWIDPIFTAVHQGHAPGFFLGWGTATAYTLQIYFDFSGYSDMAIGVARMLGIVLPLNFFSPLRSTSISELWRRWHITLSRFVRVYVYQPLCVPLTRFASNNDYGKWATMAVSVFLPAFLSMLIIGAWHGPNWTFLLFGAMQGAYIVINELYNALTRKKRRKKADSPAALFGYGLITLIAFVVAEVPIPLRDNRRCIPHLRRHGRFARPGPHARLVRLFCSIGQWHDASHGDPRVAHCLFVAQHGTDYGQGVSGTRMGEVAQGGLRARINSPFPVECGRGRLCQPRALPRVCLHFPGKRQLYLFQVLDDETMATEINTFEEEFLPPGRAGLLLIVLAIFFLLYCVLSYFLPHDRYVRYQQLTRFRSFPLALGLRAHPLRQDADRCCHSG